MSREGAMLGGYFLSETDFKKLMQQTLSVHRQQILFYLTKTISQIEGKYIKGAYDT